MGYARKLVSTNKLIRDFNSQVKEEIEVYVPYGPKGPILTEEMIAFLTGGLGSGGEPLIGESATEPLKLPVKEASAAAIATDLAAIEVLNTQIASDQAKLRWEMRSARPSFGGPQETETESWRMEPRIGELGAITLVGGTKADHVLLQKVPALLGCLELLALWSDTADTYSFAFQDEDNVACVGVPTSISFAVGANEVVPLDGIRLRGADINKDIEVDCTGGAGGEELHFIYINHWEEP